MVSSRIGITGTWSLSCGGGSGEERLGCGWGVCEISSGKDVLMR